MGGERAVVINWATRGGVEGERTEAGVSAGWVPPVRSRSCCPLPCPLPLSVCAVVRRHRAWRRVLCAVCAAALLFCVRVVFVGVRLFSLLRTIIIDLGDGVMGRRLWLGLSWGHRSERRNRHCGSVYGSFFGFGGRDLSEMR